jgi:small-conductance mechanosensitive channel/CRP-like cAMP-binding protein
MNLNWGTFQTGDWLIGLVSTLAAYVIFTFLQRFLNRTLFLKTIAFQLNLLVLALLALLFLSSQLAGLHRYVFSAVQAIAVFLLIVIVIRAIDILFFDQLRRLRHQAPVPVVVRDIGRWVLSLIVLVVLIRYFFEGVNLDVLAVSSIVAGYILGNATKDSLGNLFSGIELNTDRPFHIGDWVTMGDHTGRVVDTTWRATRLKTKNYDYIVIPNSVIAGKPIINYSCPTGDHGCIIKVGVDYGTPPHKLRQTVMQVLDDTPTVLKQPPPVVRLTDYADFSINFDIRIFIADYADLEEIMSAVMYRLWYAFKREGITIPFPIRDVRIKEAAAGDEAQRKKQIGQLQELLGSLDLFSSLSSDDLKRLAEQAQIRVYGQGDYLVREGESGGSLFLIRDGVVKLTVAQADGRQTVLASMTSGQFFGERSLLTGTQRSATATAETDVVAVVVDKPVLAPILQANTKLVASLAAVLEQRDADRAARRQADTQAPVAPTPQLVWLQRITHFFGLD